MDLRSLQYAVALEEQQSFVRAAQKVHISQPALSRSIQSLERKLGLTLFERAAQGVVPTAAGREFLARARRILYEASSLQHEMSLIRCGEGGQLAFGVGPIIAVALLPALLSQAVQRFPQMRLQVITDNWTSLLRSLQREEIEFFVTDRRLLADTADLAVLPLGKHPERAGFFCRATHPLAQRRHIRVQDLEGYTIACTQLPKQFRSAYHDLADLRPGISLVCDNIFLLKQLVRDTDTVLIMSLSAVAREVASGELVRLPLEPTPWDDDPGRALAVASLPGRTLSPAANAIIALLRETYRRASASLAERSHLAPADGSADAAE